MHKPEPAPGKDPGFWFTNIPTPCIVFFCLTLLHTFFFILIESYTLDLYLACVPTITLLFLLFYIEAYAPTLTIIGSHIICGGWPPFAFMIIPDCAVFAFAGQFIAFMCLMFLESNQHALIALLGTNSIGWAACATYYLSQRQQDLTSSSAAEWVFHNPNYLGQMMLGVAVSYVIICIVDREKRRLAFLQAKYKKDLLELNDDLKKANANLEQTNKSIQDALAERENFILRFSHEIRNPLNSLLGNVEICHESVTRAEEREMLRDAKMSGEILLQLLNNVLDSAKISAKRLEVNIQTYHFRNFIENLWVTCSEMIKKAKIFGSIAVNLNMPTYIEFDELRMKQIFLNLISNATKFTQKGFVNIFIDFLEGSEYSPSELRPKYTGVLAQESNCLLDTADNEDYFLQEAPQNKHELLTLTSLKFRNTCLKNLTENDAKTIDLQVQSHPTRPSKRLGRSSSEISIFENDTFLLSNTRPSAPNYIPSSHHKEGYIRIEIVDSGCGISEDALKNVFKKYDQFKAAATTRRIGTGLGLWITKELIELMEGKIEIYSKPRVGTCLIIMLKTRTGNLLSSPDISRDKRIRQPASRPQQIAKRVLIVEDIAYNQEINRRFLEKCNVGEIIIANNGLEAVELYRAKGEQYFDAIFTDLDMPIMDGKVATKLIREHEAIFKWKPVKIIILTGYSESATQQELLDPAGPYKADFFLSKPSSFPTFMKVLKAASKNAESPKKVLLIDFDSYNVDVITKMLERCGAMEVEALTSANIFKYYQSHQDNVLLAVIDCDTIQNPGLSIVKHIKKYQIERRVRRFPIFGATCQVGENYSRKCSENGLDGILNKPLSLSNLRDMLHQHQLLSSL